MSDDLALDFATVATQVAPDATAAIAAPTDPWLARRTLGFGASDVPALLLALGTVVATAPGYIEDRARITNRTHGIARLFAEKAGLVAPLKVGAVANKGTARERELLSHWRTLLERRVYADEGAECLIVPSSVRHADALLRSCWPLVDRHAPVLTATLDAWAQDELGCSCVVELKCSARERREIPWYWHWQIVAQLAVSGADYGLLVMGENWSAWHGDDGPVRAWFVERNEREIETVRDAARQGWAIVEGARG